MSDASRTPPAESEVSETPTPTPAPTAQDRALARQLRELEARAALAPLGEDERPTSLLVAIAVAGVLAIAVLVSVASVHDLARHGGSLPGGIFLAGVLALLAAGMYRRRYWAVLGFEALLAFQIIVTSLALIVAETLLAATVCVLSIGLAGWLFWKLVRVMGRIQAGEHTTHAGRAGTEADEHTIHRPQTGAETSDGETDEAVR